MSLVERFFVVFLSEVPLSSISYYYMPHIYSHHRPRFDDRVPGGGVVIADVGAVEEVGEGSSDEEEGDEEPIYDQPDDGDEFDE